MSLLDKAIVLAADAHTGQRRKYDGLPYIVHPIEVMRITASASFVTEDMLCAAVLHDVVEDTWIDGWHVAQRISPSVAELVMELTDKYVKDDYPHMNRRDRKAAERTRLAGISPEAQTIKLADLISNTASIVGHDPNFAVVYLREKQALLDVMTKGCPDLHAIAQQQVEFGLCQCG